MTFRYNIRLSGASSQGLMQAARILAEAAAIYDSKNAAESCSYGPEARGSASRAEIIVSDEAIDYPKVESVDFFMALTQEAYDRYIIELKPEGIIVVEQNVATGEEVAGRTLYRAPFTEIAERECGRASMVNIVVLGFFARVCDVINEQSIRHAILARAPKTSEAIYIKTYEAGINTAGELPSETTHP
jgi:2-oxoglutarate ferredoxin oxidoreductase subunit gamma